MKIFFDTNVYVAEALLGAAAERMVDATLRARWKVFCSRHVLDETRRVLVEYLGFPPRLGALTVQRVLRRTEHVEPTSSRHEVRTDANDSAILQAALQAGVDYLVTNDAHLLDLDPYEGVRIISMAAYLTLLQEHGLL